ncbi:MAG TPA: sugar phosphate isomerase/epimerase family protein [Pirellulales bacterium]|nr:sugar phosphate isomerase/epimerase family protein [Pirellulales bacterium]
MIPTLAQVSTLNSAFEKDVEDYAAGACRSLELWLGKLEGYLEKHSVDDVRRLLAEHEMNAPVASFQGGLLTSQGDFRRQHWESFANRLSLCHTLGVSTLVVVGDFAGQLTETDFERTRHSLTEAAQRAADAGVRIALEFQGRASLANNLQTAAALVAETGHPALGICFDAFHYYVGPSKLEDLGYLTTENLFHVQLCDLAQIPRELAADADRILPGDGDFLLEPIVAHLRAIGYAGPVAVELMNPNIWQIPARQFGEIAMTALRKVLGQASMT